MAKRAKSKLTLEVLTREMQEHPRESITAICKRYGHAPNWVSRLRQRADPEILAEYEAVRDTRLGRAVRPPGSLAVSEDTAEKLEYFLEAMSRLGGTFAAYEATVEKYGSFGYSCVIDRLDPKRASYDEVFAERHKSAEASFLLKAESNFQNEAAFGDWRASEKYLARRHPAFRRENPVAAESRTVTNNFYLMESASSALRGALSSAGVAFDTVTVEAEPALLGAGDGR